jgi:hypothetical protein
MKEMDQSKHNNCEGCYWFNQCGQEIICEDFTSISNEFTYDEQIYQESLDERVNDYYMIITEMDGDEDEIIF